MAISVRMWFVVPLTIPRSARMFVAARSSASSRRIGVPPMTVASNRNGVFVRRAIASSSAPCRATTYLFAVTTGIPAPSAAAIRVRAGSSPPMSSTSTSGPSATRCAGASVRSADGSPPASALGTSRTAMPVSVVVGRPVGQQGDHDLASDRPGPENRDSMCLAGHRRMVARAIHGLNAQGRRPRTAVPIEPPCG